MRVCVCLYVPVHISMCKSVLVRLPAEIYFCVCACLSVYVKVCCRERDHTSISIPSDTNRKEKGQTGRQKEAGDEKASFDVCLHSTLCW